MPALLGFDPLSALLAEELRPAVARGADVEEVAALAVATVMRELLDALELRAVALAPGRARDGAVDCLAQLREIRFVLLGPVSP